MIFKQFAVNFFIVTALSSSSWVYRGKFGRAVSAQEHEHVQIHLSKEEASSVLVDSRDLLDPDSDPLAGMNDGTGKFGRAVSAQEHDGVRIHLSKEEASSVLVDGRDLLDPDSDPLAGMNDGTGIRKLSKSSKNMPATTPVSTHRPTFNPSPPPTPPSPVDPADDVFIPAAPLDTFKSVRTNETVKTKTYHHSAANFSMQFKI